MNLIILTILAAVAVIAAGYWGVKLVSGNVALIDDWKRGYLYLSAWGIAVLGAWPDIYNAILASGFLSGDTAPEALTWGGRVLAIAALVGRFVKQNRPATSRDDTDLAGA